MRSVSVRKRSVPRGPSAAELLQTLLSGENINALFAATSLAHAYLKSQPKSCPVDTRDGWSDGTPFPGKASKDEG